MNAESQLLGCLLHCGRDDVLTICQVVPAEAITDTLNRKIMEASRLMAERDQWDVSRLARVIILEGRWPQQLHGEVSARIVDLLEACRWPDTWRDSAAAVIDAYARRRIITVLAQVTSALDDQPLAVVTTVLHDALAVGTGAAEIVNALHGGAAA